MQLAYEVARQSLAERANAQEASNADLRFHQFQPDELVLVHRLHSADYDPNNKLLLRSPWRCRTVYAAVSHWLFIVYKKHQSAKTSLHLGRMQKYHQHSMAAKPDFSEISHGILDTT